MQGNHSQEDKIIDLPTVHFPIRTFHIDRLIGGVPQECVYQATPQNWGTFNQKVAIKLYENINEVQYNFLQLIMEFQQKENNPLQKQKSQIVQIYEITNYNNYVVLIMELGQQNLYQCMQSAKGQLNIYQKIQILKQITKSVKWFHSMNSFDWLIKPESFMLFGNEFKFIEFKAENNSQQTHQIDNPRTKLFQAPENKGEFDFNFSVDIWSLGGVFYEILNEEQFPGNADGISIKSTFQPIPIGIQADLVCLLKSMLQIDPSKRPDTFQVLKELKKIENQLNSPNFLQQNQLDLIMNSFESKMQNLMNRIDLKFVVFEQHMFERLEPYVEELRIKKKRKE